AIQENIRNSKEEQFQEGFLRELFVKILGYTLNPTPDYTLITEQKNETDSKKADGSMLVGAEVVGVIELKDTKTTDLKNVETQAFGYKNNNRKAIYVVTSNFEKLRFYIDNAIDYEEFNLFTLSEEKFAVLWLCLAYENIAANLAKHLKAESVSKEEQITRQLYKDYSAFKSALFDDICTNNTDETRGLNHLLLFKKTQKLLDRLLFILFAEDSGLLPPNSIMEIVKQWEQLKELDAYTPLYDRLKMYFGYMNTGRKGVKHDIFAYNGGLFAPDEVLDSLVISDGILLDHLKKVSSYDFSSDVDVNILGHIFENSLTEIEEISAELTRGSNPLPEKEKVSKRKKDGVFYTPRYITAYIVENTIGKLCADKKAELEIVETEYFSDKKRRVAIRKTLNDKLETYRSWLLSLTICDPACGSGAFLNAALVFLMAEHRLIDEMTAKLMDSSIVFPNIENAILENNLYGVDINDESVEIARLSLWLRTAKPNRKLNSLNNNIKCGNSLISDPEVAGEKAFDWHKEFPQVFENGGFDVVIGNPPYVRPHRIEDKEKVYLWKEYKVAQQKTDLYAFFVELGSRILKQNGVLGYIIPKTWYSIYSFYNLRKLLLTDCNLSEIGILPQRVFADATVETTIIIFEKHTNQSDLIFKDVIKNSIIKTESKSDILSIKELNITPNEVQKLENVLLLGNFCEIIVGIVTGDDKKYCRFEKETDLDKKAIRGANIGRYCINYTGEYIWYNREQMVFDGNNKPKSSLKLAVGQCSPKKESDFEIPEKIVLQRIAKRVIATLDTNQFFVHSSAVIIKPNEKFLLKFILTILNSSFIDIWLKSKSSNISLNVGTIKNIPIKEISISEQQPFIALADQMLSLNSELQTKRQRFLKRLSDNFAGIKITGKIETFDELDFAQFLAELKKQKISLTLKQQDEWDEYFNEYKTECNSLCTQISAADKEIDMMVYGLYELTEEEVRVIDPDFS
ncbi:MAG: N-6 DNA methylase, partial [Tannerella sp.]|nr:N-6 DNA methylase [Tannerella sp.]